MTIAPNLQGKEEKLTKYMFNKIMTIPKFTFLFYSQIALTDGVNKIEHLLYTFLWNNIKRQNKKNKINLYLLSGGLDMVDIKSYIDSLRFKWIQNVC